MEIKIDWEYLRKNVRLFIATPMYGGMNAGLYLKSLLDLQALLITRGIENKFSFLFNESLIPRARNYMADEFLRSKTGEVKNEKGEVTRPSQDFTHFLFIDADVEFSAIDVIAMIMLNKDIVGGPYSKKSIKWGNIKKAEELAQKHGKSLSPDVYENIVGDFVFNPVPGTVSFNPGEPVEVMEIGTGYMLIQRHVFEVLKENYPHLRYRPDHGGQQNFDGSRYIQAYFHCEIDPDTHRYLSEDYFFCQTARACGLKIWLCPWMKTKHVGTYTFIGDIPNIAGHVGQV